MAAWHEWSALADAALHGMAQPWLVCVALVLTTFLLEDVAIAAGAALAVQGSLSWELSFAAVAGGIALGDLGLYALGAAARRMPFLDQRLTAARAQWVRGQLQRSLGSAVLLARVIPGLRLVTYTACGLFRLPLWQFCAWVLMAVALWTAGLLWFGAVFGAELASAWGIPAPLAVAMPIAAVALVLAGLRRYRRVDERRTGPPDTSPHRGTKCAGRVVTSRDLHDAGPALGP